MDPISLASTAPLFLAFITQRYCGTGRRCALAHLCTRHISTRTWSFGPTTSTLDVHTHITTHRTTGAPIWIVLKKLSASHYPQYLHCPQYLHYPQYPRYPHIYIYSCLYVSVTLYRWVRCTYIIYSFVLTSPWGRRFTADMSGQFMTTDSL